MYNYSMPSVFKAWLDQIMAEGRTLDFTNGPATTGRPAVLISARGGYGPGTPNHGKDHLVPALETILGDPHTLGLDLTTVTPELTLAPHTPALSTLIPLHEASMADAHEQAGQLAGAIGRKIAA